jgi:hypothetical protein
MYNIQHTTYNVFSVLCTTYKKESFCAILFIIYCLLYSTLYHLTIRPYDHLAYAVCCMLYAVCCALYAVCCALYDCMLYAVCCMQSTRLHTLFSTETQTHYMLYAICYIIFYCGLRIVYSTVYSRATAPMCVRTAYDVQRRAERTAYCELRVHCPHILLLCTYVVGLPTPCGSEGQDSYIYGKNFVCIVTPHAVQHPLWQWEAGRGLLPTAYFLPPKDRMRGKMLVPFSA